jgi:hydrogenase maturation protease
MAASVLVIGCGRRDCGHDGLGPRVAEVVSALNLPQVEVLAEEAPSVDLVEVLNEAAEAGRPSLLVIVDAALADLDHPVGTWLRIDYRETPDALRARGNRGTHAISIPEILEMARRLGVLPPKVWVYAGFGDGFEAGLLTPEVTIELASVMADVVAHDVCRFMAADGNDA